MDDGGDIAMRDGDPRGLGPVTIELNRTLAELLARLCVELETDDATGVMVEDCAVCCRPWTVAVERAGGRTKVRIERAQ